ncbi:MAG: cupredoxin domain-containing protein [Chloroflexota bacterium]|nr:cupredoxin domain-containing protein [Chloroflexota bacterium]
MATTYPTLTTPAMTVTRAPLSALNRVSAAALLGAALSLVYAQVGLLGQFAPELTLFAVLELLAATLILGYPVGGWRWTPLLGTLFGVLVLAGNWGPIVYDLTHPASFHPFAFMVIAVTLAVVSIGAGMAAAVQNYRYPAAQRRTPRGLAATLVGVAMLGVGAIAVAALPQQTGTAVSPEVLAALPALNTPGFTFDLPELRVRAGETVALRLDNTHNAPHSFDIDELNVHVPIPVGGSSLALFKATEPGTYSYYCQIPGHRELGMEGTLVVEP